MPHQPLSSRIEIEPASDILSTRKRPLDAFFSPRSVALIGASETAGTVGRTILWNLISSPFGGVVLPVNPKRKSVLGIKCYASIKDLPERVDLAVIATPAATVPGVIGECAEAGVPAAVIISAGFKECGPAGVELEAQILEQARRGRMRIVGPNCLGLMSPLTGLNATFAATMAKPGSVGFLSQSGALCTAILDWSLRENVGFSAFVSLGSMLDVGWGDLIDYLGDDPRTRSVIIYMESVGNARRFLSAARQVALTKPIIVINAGRSEAAAKAAASHTGALTGSDDVLDAAFRRSGVLRVQSIADLFHMAEVLATQPRPKGPRLAIVTNAGGPGVLATDALAGHGGDLASLSPQTIEELSQFLPPHWSHGNPVDVLGDADAERYVKAVEIVSKEPGADGLLVILAPQAMTDPTQTAEKIKRFGNLDGKPILASWMGGSSVAAGQAILNHANIPTFPYPDTAVRTFEYMWRYTYNLRGLYETPALVADASDQRAGRLAEGILQGTRQAGRTQLTEFESKELLRAYGIPVVDTRVASSEEEAVQLAAAIGFPVVLKLHSETITHKTDVDGVKLSLAEEQAVRRAFREIEASVETRTGRGHFRGVTVQPMVGREGYEIVVGSSVDAQFGPVLLFGTGGQLVEVYRDRALALPPLNTTLARRLMEQTHIYRAMKGVRGRRAVDLDAVEQALVHFGQMIVEQPRIREVDVNPFLVSAEGVVALDARVILHPWNTADDALPALAIRPYPLQYTSSFQAKDGSAFTVRPIRPEDEPAMVSFHQGLSEHSVYMRYFHALSLGRRVEHERLARICFVDYDREIALVADHKDSPDTGYDIAAVARLTKVADVREAEIALVVSDKFQHRGLGTAMWQRLVDVGRAEQLRRLTATILAENYEMQRLCEKLGFRLKQDTGEGTVTATLDL
jgi:acetyltransferase